MLCHYALAILSIFFANILPKYKGILSKGVHRILWNANRLRSGVYIARLRSGNKIFSKKIIRL